MTYLKIKQGRREKGDKDNKKNRKEKEGIRKKGDKD